MDTTEIKDAAVNQATAAKEKASEKLEQVSAEAQKMGEKVKARAGEAAGAVLDAAASGADAAKEALVLGAEKMGGRLRDLAGDDPNALQARLLGRAADGVQSATEALRDRSFADVAESVKDAARKHPGAFVAGAAVLGFLVANHLRQSQRHARLEREAEASGFARRFRRG